MAERAIRVFGDPVLKSPCAQIGAIDSGIRALVTDLLDSVRVPGRAGVAAPQIGIGVRAFSYNVDGNVGYVLNPEVVELRGERELIGEGCLSVPGLWHPTPRHPYARVRGLNLAGEVVELAGEGLMAQALQHESDHLDGLLYLDRLERDERRAAMRLLRGAGRVWVRRVGLRGKRPGGGGAGGSGGGGRGGGGRWGGGGRVEPESAD